MTQLSAIVIRNKSNRTGQSIAIGAIVIMAAPLSLTNIVATSQITQQNVSKVVLHWWH